MLLRQGVTGGGVRVVEWAPTGNVVVVLLPPKVLRRSLVLSAVSCYQVGLQINLFAVYETTGWTWGRHRSTPLPPYAAWY